MFSCFRAATQGFLGVSLLVFLALGSGSHLRWPEHILFSSPLHFNKKSHQKRVSGETFFFTDMIIFHLSEIAPFHRGWDFYFSLNYIGCI